MDKQASQDFQNFILGEIDSWFNRGANDSIEHGE